MIINDSTSGSNLRKFLDRFLIAFSFAGEQREIVRAIAESVEQRLTFGSVFFDEWFEADLAGSAADLKLQKIYSEGAEVVVVCASQEYADKPWTIVEWDAIRARHMKLRTSDNRKAADRILPLRVAEGEVEGLMDNTIFIDARQRTVKYISNLIVHRLQDFVPTAGKPHVFLAETTPDLEDEDKPVNLQKLHSFLEDSCGAVVLPENSAIDLTRDQFQVELETKMGTSLAFVQLLSEYPWRGGGFDVAQYEVAKMIGCPMFRFRGDIDLDNVEKSYPEHRLFLTANGSISGSFEDFKHHLAEKLKTIEIGASVNIRKLQEEDRRSRIGDLTDDDSNRIAEPPLIRVAVRAQRVNEVWDPIFQYLHEHENIELDELAPNESFTDRQEAEPCHGFLILCDNQAQIDENLSPRDALRQCRLIQIQLKDSSCLPPAAVVYWPPPHPAWSRLLKCTPRLLHRVLGDSLEADLQDFLKQVRQMRGSQS